MPIKQQAAPTAEDVAAAARNAAAAPAKDSAAPNYIGPSVGTRTDTMIGDQGMRRQTQTVQTAVPATYVTDDKWSVWGEMSPAFTIEVQQAMKDAGYIDSYRPGVLTDKEFGAMNDIMAVANTKGMTWDEALLDTRAKAAANPQVGGKATGGGAKRAPLVYQLSNPDNIASVAQKAARDLIGRKMSDTEIKAFTDSFHSAERDYQSAAYGVTANSPDGTTITDAPDVGVLAEKQLRQANPTEVDGASVANVFNSFTNLLDGKLG